MLFIHSPIQLIHNLEYLYYIIQYTYLLDHKLYNHILCLLQEAICLQYTFMNYKLLSYNYVAHIKTKYKITNILSYTI